MSEKAEPSVSGEAEALWAAWQARGLANDRASRRKLVIVAAILVVSAAVLNALWFLRS